MLWRWAYRLFSRSFLPAALVFLSSQFMISQTKNKGAKRVPTNTWASQTLSRLSIEEKVGQLIMPAFRAVHLHDASQEFQDIVRQVRDNHAGGFILFGGDVYEAAALIDRVQTMSKLPLLIASDFERGAGFRIRNTVSFPWNMAIGAAGSAQWAYLQGKVTAQESRALGVHWVLAPVLDVNSNPANPVINIRSYGEDPELAATLGAAFIRGAQEGGVLATAKHFPGHGDTETDSHLSLPLMKLDRQRLEALELVPFRRAIQSGVRAVMTAHLALPALEPKPGTPATLSENVQTKLLQGELGFSGLVVTDSLTMAGLANEFWPADAAVRAIKAGVDVLLDPPNPDATYHAVLDAFRTGEISEERLDHSVRKVLEAKVWLGLHRKRRVDFSQISRLVNDPKLQEQAQLMAEASITLGHDPGKAVPIDARRVRSAHGVLVLSRDCNEETGVFERECRRRLDAVTFDRISVSSSDAELEAALERARTAEWVLCGIFARVVTGTGTVGLPARLKDWIQRLSQIQKPVVHVALGSPYVLPEPAGNAAYLYAFSNADVSQAAAVRAMFGEVPIQGKLPVSLPGVASVGEGIQRDRLVITLKPAGPDSSALRSRLTRALDPLMAEQIARQAFPGASLAVGFRNQLVFQKAYGKLDNSPEAQPATPETIYDLASLTKVITATTLAMRLFEQDQLKLDYPVHRFLRPFQGEGREKITIRHLLTHSSGLPAHLPLYKDTRGKGAFVQKILQVPLEYQPGTKAIYSDLGIILLGDIIEKITAQPLDQLATEQIFRPLGMSQSFFNPKPNVAARIAPTENDPWRGRLLRGEVHDENAYAMGGVSAHAGLFGTSGDLSVFCQMLLNGGVYDHRRIVRRSTLEQFTARQDFPKGSSRALGWDTPSQGGSAGSEFSPSSFGHTGFTGTSIWVDPKRELFVILLTNRVHPTRENNAIREVRRLVADAVAKAVDEAG